jgi:hypothetical protein
MMFYVHKVAETAIKVLAFLGGWITYTRLAWLLLVMLCVGSTVSPYLGLVGVEAVGLGLVLCGITYWVVQLGAARGAGTRGARVRFHLACAASLSSWLLIVVLVEESFRAGHAFSTTGVLLAAVLPVPGTYFASTARGIARDTLQLPPARKSSSVLQSVTNGTLRLFGAGREKAGDPLSKTVALWAAVCWVFLLVGVGFNYRPQAPDVSVFTRADETGGAHLECNGVRHALETIDPRAVSAWSGGWERRLPCLVVDEGGAPVIQKEASGVLVTMAAADGTAGGIVLNEDGSSTSVGPEDALLLEVWRRGGVVAVTNLREVASGTFIRIARTEGGGCALSLLGWGDHDPSFVDSDRAPSLLWWFIEQRQWGRSNTDGTWRFKYPAVRAVAPAPSQTVCPTDAEMIGLSGMVDLGGS